MRYGMLGDDRSSTADKLAKYTGVVGWQFLKPHFESGALLYVDPGLPLIQVGRALADDDMEAVAGWLRNGDLVRPSAPHADHWEKSGARFTALVVSPFVLVQPAPDGS
ncbi:hypothetical protein BH23VER1_BH23VER1_26840 [soil metagenome]